MPKSLNEVNPAGRFDVLAFRLLEKLAASQCPNEWPILKPMIEQQLKQQLGPKGKVWQKLPR